MKQRQLDAQKKMEMREDGKKKSLKVKNFNHAKSSGYISGDENANNALAAKPMAQSMPPGALRSGLSPNT